MTTPPLNAPLDESVVRHVAQAIHDARCACGQGEGTGIEFYLDHAQLALDALRELPVSQRMEAMAMRRVLDYDDPDDGMSESGLWVESRHERLSS